MVIVHLEEFFDYKNEAVKTFCHNENIVRLITDSKEAPVPNYDLAYKQIFPYEYVPDTVDDGKVFLCLDVDIVEVPNKTFYVPVMYLWAFAHKSKIRLDEGGIRTDQLCVEIDKELNGSRFFGLGELNLFHVGRFSPNTGYQGRVMAYSAKVFNRLAPSKRPPAKRKQRE